MTHDDKGLVELLREGWRGDTATDLMAEAADRIDASEARIAAEALRAAAESYVYVHAVSRAHSRVYRWLMDRAARLDPQPGDPS